MKSKLITYVPTTHADKVREAIAEAGGGKLGKYTHCTFSTRALALKPTAGAQPHVGSVGVVESVEEERIEVTCAADMVAAVIAAIRRVHPYEEIPIDVYTIE